MKIENCKLQIEEKQRKPLGPFVRLFGNHLLLLVLCAAMALPFVWMVLTSFKPLAEAERTNWVPREWKPENYPGVFKVR